MLGKGLTDCGDSAKVQSSIEQAMKVLLGQENKQASDDALYDAVCNNLFVLTAAQHYLNVRSVFAGLRDQDAEFAKRAADACIHPVDANFPQHSFAVMEKGLTVLYAAFEEARRQADKATCLDILASTDAIGGIYQDQVWNSYRMNCTAVLEAQNLELGSEALLQMNSLKDALKTVSKYWPESAKDVNEELFDRKVAFYGRKIGMDTSFLMKKTEVKSRFSLPFELSGRTNERCA